MWLFAALSQSLVCFCCPITANQAIIKTNRWVTGNSTCTWPGHTCSKDGNRKRQLSNARSQGPTSGLARLGGRDLLTSVARELGHDGISKWRTLPRVHFRSEKGDTSASQTPPSPFTKLILSLQTREVQGSELWRPGSLFITRVCPRERLKRPLGFGKEARSLICTVNCRSECEATCIVYTGGKLT
jgi:hypothetical protein